MAVQSIIFAKVDEMFFLLYMVFSKINPSYLVCYITIYATTHTVSVEVIIICSLFIDCVHSSIRLVGSSPLEGRVEICYHGVWNTVCNTELYFSRFDDFEGSVAC